MGRRCLVVVVAVLAALGTLGGCASNPSSGSLPQKVSPTNGAQVEGPTPSAPVTNSPSSQTTTSLPNGDAK